MPKQTSDIFMPGDYAIAFSKSGQKWKIDKEVDVGANGPTVVSEFTDSTLVNKGYIYSYSAYGVWFTRDNGTLINKETGHINGGTFGVYFDPVLSTDVNGSVENHGKIFGNVAGIYSPEQGDFATENHGEIYGYTYGIYSVGFFVGSTKGPVIKNYDSIKSDQFGIYLVAIDENLRSKVVNQKDGVIEGGTLEDGYAAVFNANGDMTLINKGKIKGGVSGTTGEEFTLTNTGKIKGDVRLGFEDDKLDNRDGNITGYIWGHFGRDKLIAGDKKEKFVFDDLTDFDRVKNFESGKDTFILDQNAFLALAPGPLEKSAFRRGTEAEDGDDRIIYDETTGNVYYDIDGDGGGFAPVRFAKVDAGQKLKYSDFIIDNFV
ncbi:hypothetical protein [Bauldia sp.]|uniref:hypothetical protein n=1 Tax=Bauldia sp. TaxID=2575872 RepID=UPI003BA8D842